MKEKLRIARIILTRICFSALIFTLCIIGIKSVGTVETSTISSWIVALPIFTLAPLFYPIEFHLDYHEYAKKRYEELLIVETYCLNPAQENWTKRLIMYLDACQSKHSKVSPEEMNAFIKKCVESAKVDDFGANSPYYDDYDPNDAKEFLKVVEPFAYLEG